MTKGILKQIKKCNELFASKDGVRTEAWKEQKRLTNELIKKSKRGFMDVQRDHILGQKMQIETF